MEQDLTSQDFQVKTAKSSPKKQTANDKLDESLGAKEMAQSQLSLNLLKIEETNLKENNYGCKI